MVFKVFPNSPRQLSVARPDPVYPTGHVHWKEPGMSKQVDLLLHAIGQSVISESKDIHKSRAVVMTLSQIILHQ